MNAETGERYRVRLTPRERTGRLGVDLRLDALVFETREGQWVGSVPIYHTVEFERLTEDDLRELFDQAAARG